MSILPVTNSYLNALMKFPNKVCAKYYAFEFMLDLAQITEGNIITSRQMKLLGNGYNSKVLVFFEKNFGFIKKLSDDSESIGLYVVDQQLIDDRMAVTNIQKPVLATNMTEYINQLYSLKFGQYTINKISIYQLCVYELNVIKLVEEQPDMCFYLIKKHLYGLYLRMTQILADLQKQVVIEFKNKTIDAVIILKSDTSENISVLEAVTTTSSTTNKRKKNTIEDQLQSLQEQLDILRYENATMRRRLLELEANK